jgi:hypothetical protein
MNMLFAQGSYAMNVPHLRRDASAPRNRPATPTFDLQHLSALKAEKEYRAYRRLRRIAALVVIGFSLVVWAIVLIALFS